MVPLAMTLSDLWPGFQGISTSMIFDFLLKSNIWKIARQFILQTNTNK